MRYGGAAFILLVLCAGCFPKKTPEGNYSVNLWSMPVKVSFHDGKMGAKGTYKDAPVTIEGTYDFNDKDGGAEFSFNVTDVQIKHGNPFTQQMLSQEIQNVVNPRNFRGYLKFDNPQEMDFVVEGGGSDTHVIFKKI